MTDGTRAARGRVAVIGAGIAGMGAAWHLSGDHHRVVLIEAADRIGGHARTRMAGPAREDAVDTGFIVFNYANYPNLVRLFAELDVPVRPSDMSFGASIRGGEIEYGLQSADVLFAQRRNLVRPAFLRMVRDIFRFNARALDAVRPGMTIADLLEALGTGPWFRDHYLLPLSGAIWSAPTARILDFPAETMLRFFKNHALLHHTGQHQWYTVEGGSVTYVTRLAAALAARGVEVRTGAAVAAVRRSPFAAEVRLRGGEWERFDEVVFATHADVTAALIADPTPEERAAFAALSTQPNRIVLHSDPSVMPRRRKIWSSWTYAEPARRSEGHIDLSYWMNSLQTWLRGRDYFVTLNPARPIRDELIWDETVMRHPVYDHAAIRAQGQVAAMNGANRTWFCGAWMRNGFHEDGLASAVAVAEGMRLRRALEVAAE